MTHRLYRHLSQFVTCSEADFREILSYFQVRRPDKKEVLMEAGRRCDHHYFVLEGCLHMFYVSDKGAEKTVKLALEDWWLTDYLAFHHRKPTEFYIQAVEPSRVLCIDYERQEQLLADFPALETYFRKVYEIAYGATIMRIKYLYDYSKEEMFLNFIDQFPDFAQRVPQYLLASYLGLTPEYLSEIRRKKRS
ncbi:Crp/Fnr family transcriptional regulator [Flavilitoribacter nigricans]|uniref:Cyclic nucleotide-binding protein n=1 Tax=Flavilitoribacter nigricans (strain ATCC 23147 / DSM 23189 / NBRC 102662 / NCIMB 1420 / SS-2) TaxID=1122177 RepID=A0A2D0MXK2_FLAN2|nr:Crp/Fnr family transcriptional regulator [Flavilitoribacter nigricans]PHN00900.1 cyclic nucleotide-binding protein [Flavilitoribacter nigricans DSM 23189 = NBRC 102662]